MLGFQSVGSEARKLRVRIERRRDTGEDTDDGGQGQLALLSRVLRKGFRHGNKEILLK